MLDVWSLKRSRLKKRVYATLFERRNLESAAGLHFLNDSERAEAETFGVTTRSFVIPNAVDPEEFTDLPTRQTLDRLEPRVQGRTVVLFLGRLHEKKGLDILVPAFAEASVRTPDLHLLIAGPDEGGYRSSVEGWIDDHDLRGSVTLLGPVYGRDKMALLGGADIFVLSSHEEGDSIAVKEAMAARLPVVVTRQCRIHQVETAKAGLVVDPRPASVADALVALAEDSDGRKSLGTNGLRLVQEHYAAPLIGRLMLDTYTDILQERTRAPTWR
jgi:glycosyltransferase involved in cell wall biosynthesis